MASYCDWNKWLIEYFFNERNASREVFLIACPVVINQIGNSKNIESPENDFVNAIKNCDLRKPGHKNIIHVADHLRFDHKISDYKLEPQYVAFLAFLVYSICKSENLTGRNQIPDIQNILREDDLREDYNKRVPKMWKALESWTVKLDNERGIFKAEYISKYKNVGYAFRQALFRKKDHKIIKNALLKLRMQPGGEINREQANQVLYSIPASHRIGKLHRKGDTSINEFLTDRIIDVYNQWDGSDGSKQSQGSYPLTMTLRIDKLEEEVLFRAKIKNPNNVGLREGEEIQFENGFSVEWYDQDWSGPLLREGEYFDSTELLNEAVSLKSNEKKLSIGANIKKSPILFSNGDCVGDKGSWIESSSPKSQEVLVLCQNPYSCDGVKSLDYDGIPDGWHLQKIDVVTIFNNGTALSGINERLNRPQEGDSILSFIGGVKFRNEYFKFAPPRLKVPSSIPVEVWCNGEILEKREFCEHYDISNYIKDDIYGLDIKLVCNGITIEESRIEFVKSTLDSVESLYRLDPFGAKSLDGIGIFGSDINDREFQCSDYVESRSIVCNRSFTIEKARVKIPPNKVVTTLNNDVLQIVKQHKMHRMRRLDLVTKVQGIISSNYKISERSDPSNFIVNILIDLGFLEQLEDYVSLTPPAFVQKLTKRNEAFLIGWRNQEMLRKITDLCSNKDIGIVNKCSFDKSYLSENQWFNLLPTPISIVAKDEDSLHSFIEKVGIGFSNKSNSWAILNWVDGKDNVLSKIQRGWTHRELTSCRDFYNFRTLGWGREIPTEGYGFFREEDYTGTKFYLCKDEQVNRISYDWGINICLGSDDNYSLFYDESKKVLLCPYKARLPHLIGRTVALCNGTIPRLWGNYLESGNNYLGKFYSIKHLGWHNKWFIAYRDVPWTIAKKVGILTGRQIDKV